jgi:hypothetical protein
LTLIDAGWAQGQINVLRNGWITDEFDVVYCNNETNEASIDAITPGRFVGTLSPKIGAKQCGSFSFVTDQSRVILHVKSGETIKVLSHEIKPSGLLSTETFKNLIFLLLGVVLVGIQDLLKYIFVGPITAMKLWLIYKSNVRSFKRMKDDIGKGFMLTGTLVDLDTKPSAETAFVTSALALRVGELIDLHRSWQSERPLSNETREKIDGL